MIFIGLWIPPKLHNQDRPNSSWKEVLCQAVLPSSSQSSFCAAAKFSLYQRLDPHLTDTDLKIKAHQETKAL